jgi:hypothetical protein
MQTFYKDARNACIRARTIPAFAVVWVGFAYDLLIADVRSMHLFHWIGQTILGIVSNGLPAVV